MRVLKPGSGQRGWAQKYTCTGKGNQGGGCGAELLVEQGDLFHTTTHALHETDYHVTFECCECKVWTDIPERDIPMRVRELPYRAPGRRRETAK